MTEEEWLDCADLKALTESVEPVSQRKLMLFGCACCYRQWPLIPDGCCKDAVEIAERFADNLCRKRELRRVRRAVSKKYPNLLWYQDFRCFAEAASYYATFDLVAARDEEVEHPLDRPGDYITVLKRSEVAELLATATASTENQTNELAWHQEVAAQCVLFRDIVGNPFRPVHFLPSWRTEATTSLAQRMYNDRDFTNTPILADALEEAGCTVRQVLDHCRSGTEHVRGCWVVDGVLGRQ